MIKLYEQRGFTVASIHADPEFEPLRPYFPILHVCGADDHVPDIERYIRTVKDRARSAYCTLPFQRLPRIIVIHLIRNAVFWLNAFPAAHGVSDNISPRCLLTGYEVDYNKHVRLEFGKYVQTNETHDHQMLDCTTGAIGLGPTGNRTGTHWFFSLASGTGSLALAGPGFPCHKRLSSGSPPLGANNTCPSL
ncbi:hypothetical protein ACA910_000387 [Epithemia clementina (nom. ined.)]